MTLPHRSPHRYRIARRLTSRGPVEAYEAFVVGEGGFERRVALRPTRMVTPDQGELVRRFFDSCRAVRGLQHPNLISVVDYGLMDGVPFQVLEYVDGLGLEALAARLTRLKRPTQPTRPTRPGACLSPEIALFVVQELASALEALHAVDGFDPQGLVHPDNVVVSWLGDVKLDGAGAPPPPQDPRTSAFAAPEVMAGAPTDSRASVFALGCLLQWLVTGFSPIAGPRAPSESDQGPPVAGDLPTDVAQIAGRATRTQPELRFPDLSAMRQACALARAKRRPGDPRTYLRDQLRAEGGARPSAGPVMDPEVELILQSHDREALRRFASAPPRPTPRGDAPSSQASDDVGPRWHEARLESANRAPSAVEEPPGDDEPITALVEPGEALTTALAEGTPRVADLSSAAAAPTSERPEATRVVGPGQTAHHSDDARRVTPTPSDSDRALVDDDEDDPLIGTVLHGYMVEARLGRGSLARVYRARHLVLDHAYAVKVLYGAAAGNERAQERLRREAQVLNRLRHPNIVSVIDFGTTPSGYPFLTMELLTGRTLRQVIKSEAPLPGPRVAAIARQIAEALAYAHLQGVVHRDVKPSNVMLVTKDGPGQTGTRDWVKVLDFGIARMREIEGTRLTATDALLGTPRYMAPEQITGASHVGPAADLYALGVIMYSMLAGDAPFAGPTLDVVERQLLEKPRPLPTDTGLEPLVMQLLEKQSDLRPPSGAAVVKAIDSLGLAATVAYDADLTRTSGPDDSAATAARRSPRSAEPAELPERGRDRSFDRATRVASERESSPRWVLLFVLAGIVALGSALITAVILSGAEPTDAPVAPRLQPRASRAPVAVAEPRSPPIERAEPAVVSAAPPSEPAGETAAAPNTGKLPAKAATKPPTRAVDLSGRRKAARRRLRQSGLSESDVKNDAALRSALGALDRAVRTKDPAAARRAERRLETAIKDALSDARIQRRLDAFASRLRDAAGTLDAERLSAIEDRYLDLRAQARPSRPQPTTGAPAPRSKVRTLRRLSALEKTLDDALSR